MTDDRPALVFLLVLSGAVFVLVVVAVVATTSTPAAPPPDPTRIVDLDPVNVRQAAAEPNRTLGPIPPPDVELAAGAVEITAKAYFEGVAAARAAEAAAIAYIASLPPPDSPETAGNRRAYDTGGTLNAGGHLASIRQCESGGDYGAISPGGQYRGAYQFDYQTWAGVGGSGDPAAASPAEQDHRAQILYEQRGAQPWPVCGR